MKTFVIFATFLSLAFASQELLQCMDDRAKKAGKEEKWIEDHQEKIEGCETKQDEAGDAKSCDKDEAKSVAAHSHQHEACIFLSFGWVDQNGKVNVAKMFEDFNADAAFKTQVEGTLEDCVKNVGGTESQAVSDMHDAYVDKCPSAAGVQPTAEQEEKLKQQMLAKIVYGAEAKCAMGEMTKACGI